MKFGLWGVSRISFTTSLLSGVRGEIGADFCFSTCRATSPGSDPGLKVQMPKERTDMTADRSRWIPLYVLCMGMLMVVLDVTVVNVALPSIQDALGFSTSSLAWVVNGYLISFGGLLLLAGRLGDLLGRRTIFLAGVALFTGA